MNNIPLKIRNQLAADPFMLKCFRHAEGECDGRIEWEHAHQYRGRQVQEPWAIVPACTFHHRGAGLIKELNRYAAILRAEEMNVDPGEKYPRTDWPQVKKYLAGKYPGFRLPIVENVAATAA